MLFGSGFGGGVGMSTGSRRASWQVKLDEQMAPVHMASMAMQNQITDLRNEVSKIKRESLRMYILLVAVAILGILTAVIK